MLPKSSRLHRRRFLQCVGASAAAMPFLRTLPSYAQADAVPKLILGFTGNGRIRHLWGGENAGDGLMLRQNLAPLQPWAKYITIAENLYNPAALPIGGTHEGGAKTLFTGGGAAVTSASAGAGGPSIDTLFMAAQTGSAKSTSFYQQVVAERNSAESAGPNNRLVFDSDGAAREPHRSGWEAVDVYLKDVVAAPSDMPSSGPSPQDLARSKMFESLNGQLGDLESRLCSEDYYQMGAMREAVAKASSTMQLVVNCEIPELPAKPDLPDYEPIWQPPQRNIDLASNSDWYYLRGHLATDLLVMALSCGVTRAGVLQFDQAAGEAQATGHPMTHHNQSHDTPTSLQPFLVAHNWVSEADPYYSVDYQMNPPDGVRMQYQASWDLLTEWELYYANQFAYLLQQLEAFDLLGDTALLWGSEIDLGGAHNHMSMPSLLVSGDKLPFARGKSIVYPPFYADSTEDNEIRPLVPVAGAIRNHNDLLSTVLTGLGVPTDSVGTASDNGGVLTEVLPG
jgi:hypothetical protein